MTEAIQIVGIVLTVIGVLLYGVAAIGQSRQARQDDSNSERLNQR